MLDLRLDQLERQDLVTMARLAKDSCLFMESRGQPVPEWAKPWWLKYQHDEAIVLKEEAEFKKQKELKEKALSKLTEEEKKTLGL